MVLPLLPPLRHPEEEDDQQDDGDDDQVGHEPHDELDGADDERVELPARGLLLLGPVVPQGVGQHGEVEHGHGRGQPLAAGEADALVAEEDGEPEVVLADAALEGKVPEVLEAALLLLVGDVEDALDLRLQSILIDN